MTSLTDILEGLAESGSWIASKMIADYIEEAIRAPSLAVAAAIELVAVGFAMLADDILDLGRTDHLHHWMIGLALLAAGLIVLYIILLHYSD